MVSDQIESKCTQLMDAMQASIFSRTLLIPNSDQEKVRILDVLAHLAFSNIACLA